MAKVFEIRLLELWEAKYGHEEREAAQQASLRAAMELLALEDGTEECGISTGSGTIAVASAGLKERRKRLKRRKREAAKEALGEQQEALRAAEMRASASREEGGDEIDAEFNRRVLEHLKTRAEEAKKNGTHSQTDRGNAILKTLCEKLKAQLEEEPGIAS